MRRQKDTNDGLLIDYCPLTLLHTFLPLSEGCPWQSDAGRQHTMKKYSLFSSFSCTQPNYMDWSWSDIYLNIVLIVIVGFFTFCQWPYHKGWTNKIEVYMEIVLSHWMKWCQERWVMRNLRGKTKAWLSFSAPSFEDLVTPEGIDDGRPVFRENCTLTHRSLGAVTSLSGLFCARRQLWEKWKWFALFLATKDLCLARLLLQSRARDLFTSK